MVAFRRPLPLAGLCLALLPVLACLSPDPSLPYLCDNTDGGGCPEGSYCGVGEDHERRCLPLAGRDAGKADAAAPADAAAAPPDAAEEMPDAASPPDASVEPADASKPPADAGAPDAAVQPADAGSPADASRPDGGGTPDASPECVLHSQCPFCEKCSAGACVPQGVGEDQKSECPDDRLCGTGACNGNGACGVKPATDVCRAAVLECDLEEKCDGVTDGCPTDKFKLANTLCRSATKPCDKEDRCSGTAADCPDAKQPGTYRCAEAKCVGNNVSPEAYCKGGDECPTVINSCGDYGCKDAACLTSCTAHADCISGVCDVRPPGTCIAPAKVVEPNCEDSNTSIQSAINACTRGTPCYIKPKSYGACDNIVIKDKDVTIVGGTIHPASGHGPGVSIEEGSTDLTVAFLHGMTIESASGSVPGGIHVFATGGSTGKPELTATRCTIRSNGLYGIDANKAKLLVDGCEITGNTTNGIFMQSTEATIQNTILSRNGQWGVVVQSPTGTQAFRFNTVVHNAGGAVSCDASATPSLVSSLFWGNAPQGCAVDASSDVPGVADACLNGTNEPGFVDPANSASGDYHLNPASGCVDRQTCSLTTDVDGNPRPYPAGGLCDIGAHENQIGD